MINVEHRSVFTGVDTPDPSPDADDSARAATPVSILLVEDEGIIARDLEDTLTRLGYRVAGVAGEAAQAVALAEKLEPDLIVMDVSLRGEGDGIQAAREIQELLDVPIVFLTGHSDTETLQRAVRTNPLGYLIKPFQEAELHSTIEVAIHKHRSDVATRKRAERMQNLSLIDELTQLKNRRGFFELGQQALKVAKREHQALGLFFMDMNGLKRINDSLGHLAGDQALRDTAGVLRHTFRDADIIARIGGDEFVALAHIHATQDMTALCNRLREHLRAFNAACTQPYTLDVSIGTATVTEPGEEDLEALLARADAAMYEEKRAVASRE